MPQTKKETLRGGQLIERVRQLIHEGNVRRITVKQGDRIIAEFPLTVGVVGTIFAPVLAAIGALAALLSECTIEIEHTEEAAEKKSKAVKKAEEKKELVSVG